MATIALLTTWFICVASLGVFGRGWLAAAALSILTIVGIIIILALHQKLEEPKK